MNFMLLCNAHSMMMYSRSTYCNSIHVLCHEFNELTLEHQFIEIMSNPLYYRIVSKFMYDILNKRRFLT